MIELEEKYKWLPNGE